MNSPLLSVCLITYNHKKYIRDAIEGILMQQVNFTWELIIADDFSTDGTRDILLEYKNKYPDFITLILQEKNVGPAQNFIDLISKPVSKYIAYNEGDDYWTDPLKLQKQIDFLESNPNYSFCFHSIDRIKDLKHIDYFPELQESKTFFLDDIISNWFISIGSMVYRNNMLQNLELFKITKVGDQALCILLATNGPFFYISSLLSVYRLLPNGLTNTHNSSWTDEVIKLLQNFNKQTNFKFTIQIQKKLFELYSLKIDTVNKQAFSIGKYKYKTVLILKFLKYCSNVSIIKWKNVLFNFIIRKNNNFEK